MVFPQLSLLKACFCTVLFKSQVYTILQGLQSECLKREVTQHQIFADAPPPPLKHFYLHKVDKADEPLMQITSASMLFWTGACVRAVVGCCSFVHIEEVKDECSACPPPYYNSYSSGFISNTKKKKLGGKDCIKTSHVREGCQKMQTKGSAENGASRKCHYFIA